MGMQRRFLLFTYFKAAMSPLLVKFHIIVYTRSKVTYSYKEVMENSHEDLISCHRCTIPAY